MSYVPFEVLKKQVEHAVFYRLKELLPVLEFHVYQQAFEESEWVEFMRREIYSKYENGEVPSGRLEVLKTEWSIQLLPSLKSELRIVQ
ncbi:hypothetical protein I6N96_12670 [Enterococcus sp. BWM-S5]|uniref:Uncharacterized protein n=1 Tax=Enterococcus larvae TaxID=2794352 RepID=A0ABS4CLH2_9ENTE|nr:hypothetical protein [Enterococcus larvae]MBP1047127.1 hypothetical protein [Enterococcus larvae]